MPANRLHLRRHSIAALLALAGGCGLDRPFPAEPGVSPSIPVVSAVLVTSATDSLEVGQIGHLVAVPVDGAGTPLPDRSVIWSASVPEVATISSDGTVVALAPGVLLATATAGDRSASVLLTIRPPLADRATQVELLPRALVLAPGSSHPLGAIARDQGGAVLHGLPADFESADPAVATVDREGRLVALAPGIARISARIGGAVAELAVRVEIDPAMAFSIDLRAVGVAAEHADELRRAAARWERVVHGDLADVTLSLPAGFCGVGIPELSETVDDLLVIVRIDTLDGPGATIASASQCVARQDGRAPVVGVVRIDAEDLPAIRALGLLESVVAHEIGHVLGIGTQWREPARGLLGESSGSPVYLGPRARQAAAWLGFTAAEGEPVPLEGEGGSGTRGLHWRESVFRNELMTGWLEDGSPLSTLSVAALADLGYEVHAGGADSFSSWLAGTAGSTQPAALFGRLRAAPLLVEQLQPGPRLLVR